jgi:hypothetical protein
MLSLFVTLNSSVHTLLHITNSVIVTEGEVDETMKDR